MESEVGVNVSDMHMEYDSLCGDLLYTQRDILEKDFCALKREKSNELYYVNQKLADEKESNRVLLQRVPLHELNIIVFYIIG